MGYDLRPRNSGVDTFCMGAFSYAWMMDTAVGMVVGYGPGLEPGSYVSYERKDKCDLMHNDGGRISAKEAKEMAKMARLVAAQQDLLHYHFDRLDEATKNRYRENNSKLYKLPVRKDFVQKLKDFADFAEKSGGFRVY